MQYGAASSSNQSWRGPIRVDVDSPGGSESLGPSIHSPGAILAQGGIDERGNPNHSLGPDSVGASEFRQQVW